MKKFKLVVRIIFLCYISLTILIGYNDDLLIREGFGFLWDRGIFNFYENMKYWGLAGIILIVFEFTLENMQIYGLKKENNSREAEIIKLKAQLFDLKSSSDPEPDQEEEVKEESPEGEQAG